tara:strand:- start:736 stop:1425 length:690 start_codon:yes stop_codon:yes gene_type:complete
MSRRAKTRALALLLTWGLALGAAAQGEVRAEGVAAIVGAPTPRQGAQVVLLSDVDLRARMRLAGQRTGEIHLGPLPAPLLVATLDELLGEALIAREAERVQLASPTDRDVRDERRRLEGLAGGAARLTSLTDALGVDDEEIDAMARRRAMVKVFLEANLQGAATIDDAQIDRIYQSGEHPFQGQELEDVREPMRVWLTRRALENSVRRWVEVLRARTTIRVLAPYGGNR